jgi:DNA-binding NarL/FixJ family response regulator
MSDISPESVENAPYMGVLIAEEEALSRQLMHSAVATLPGVTVIGETENLYEALEWIKTHNPEFVIFGRSVLGPRGSDVIRSLMQRQPTPRVVMFGRTAASVAEAAASPAAGPRLSAREREVLRLVASGLSSRETAERLKLSVRTIENHRARISRRTGLKSIAQLALYAAQLGLVPSRVAPRPAPAE